MSAASSLALETALTYARRGWPVLLLHTVQDSRCSCGRPACEAAGKHPRTIHGLKDRYCLPGGTDKSSGSTNGDIFRFAIGLNQENRESNNDQLPMSLGG